MNLRDYQNNSADLLEELRAMTTETLATDIWFHTIGDEILDVIEHLDLLIRSTTNGDIF